MFVLPWDLSGIGGVNIVVSEMCKALSEFSNYKPYVLVLDWNAKRPVFEEKSYYTEIRFRLREPFTENASALKSMAAYFFHLPQSLLSLYTIIKKNNISVINPHFLELAYSPISNLKVLCKNCFKLVYSTHGSDILNANTESMVSRFFWRILIKPSNTIVACSQGLAEQTRKTFFNVANVTHIHNGISPEFKQYLNAPNELLIGDLKDKKYILSVGTYEHKKGHDVLIKAFKELIKENRELYLVLVGRTGPELNNLKQLINDLDLSGKVSIVCDVSPENIPVYFKYASIYVSASRYEPFGIVILEAGVAGLPIIATSTMGANEIISNNDDGIIVPIDDSLKLGEGLSFYLNNPRNMVKYGVKMQNKVNTKFSWKSSVKNYLKLVE